MIRKLLPYSLKLRVKLLRRWLHDIANKRDLLFAEKMKVARPKPSVLTTEQVIRKSHLYENKVHNLKLGASQIEQVVIKPNETFSFWKTLGKPSEKKGYRKGRNIVGGVLSEDIGGGLCQLSGITFYTGILAGLEIKERFNHTVDIYQEHERLSPLGTDATVVYGYKDLRLKNPFNFPIQFSFEITDEKIICRVCAPEKIEKKRLVTDRRDHDKSSEVKLFYDGEDKCFCKSYYLKPS